MDFYAFAKHWLVIGGFGALVGLSIMGYGYWIYQLIAYICKKVKTHKDKKALKQ